jgi:ribonuclease VapC
MIVDSSALIAVLRLEEGFERLVEAMLDADSVLVPAPCYLEVAMVIAGRKGPDSRPEIDALLGQLRATVVAVGAREAHAAADAFLRYGKGRHPAGLSFGDCMAYAVAQAAGAPLLFTGEDFARTDVIAAAPAGQ